MRNVAAILLRALKLTLVRSCRYIGLEKKSNLQSSRMDDIVNWSGNVR